MEYSVFYLAIVLINFKKSLKKHAISCPVLYLSDVGK